MTTTHCRYCMAKIPTGARFCATCEHHQSGWAQFWSQFKIQDLTTVISVGALAITSVVSGGLNWNVFNPHAVLEITALSCTDSKIDVAISNIGNRAAFVKGGKATFIVADQPYTPDHELTLPASSSLKPSQSGAFEFAVDSPPPIPARTGDRKGSFLRYEFQWVEPGTIGQRVTGTCRQLTWPTS